MIDVGLQRLNSMRLPDALKAFRLCCGSGAWCFRMASGRPYPNRSELLRLSELKFLSMTRQELSEALARTNTVVEELRLRGFLPEEIPSKFEALCDRYERKFGHQFIAHVNGHTPDELLKQLRSWMHYEPHVEWTVAAGQHALTTSDRLINLLNELAKDADGFPDASAVVERDYVKARGVAGQQDIQKSA